MTFTYDEPATLRHMAHAASVDLWNGQLTLYAVACAGSDDEPHASHGGQVCANATEAMETARHLNALEQECHYLPLAIGCHPEVLLATIRGLTNPPEEGVYDNGLE